MIDESIPVTDPQETVEAPPRKARKPREVTPLLLTQNDGVVAEAPLFTTKDAAVKWVQSMKPTSPVFIWKRLAKVEYSVKTTEKIKVS